MTTTDRDAIEAIKELKARYFRFIDCKQWKDLERVFDVDAIGFWEGMEEGGTEISGAKNIVQTIARRLTHSVTVHHGHMPEISLLDESSAGGIWAMYDYIEMPELVFEGYGHYHETYVKNHGEWRIKTLKLTRLHQRILSGSTQGMMLK